MPKNIEYGKMPRIGKESGEMGSQGKSTSVPYGTGSNKKGDSTAPYHFQNRPTGSKKFPQ